MHPFPKIPLLFILLASVFPAFAQEAAFRQLVNRWNAAHATRTEAAFEGLYCDSAYFYGTKLSGHTCIANKRAFFAKSPDFQQQIVGEIVVEGGDDGTTSATCRFQKRVTVGQKTTDYPSYLVFRQEAGAWKIWSESDLVTDENRWKKARKQTGPIPASAVSGDFNGDGKPEQMWLVPPPVLDDMDCGDGNCTSHLRFSDPTLPTIDVPMCIGGWPVNEGDLNQNGSDEIGLLPEWFTSCWQAYYVWTFKNDQWVYAVSPLSTHCIQWEDGVDAISPDPDRPGYAIIRYTYMGGEDMEFSIKSESVKVER